jgi:hypothetical protein
VINPNGLRGLRLFLVVLTTAACVALPAAPTAVPLTPVPPTPSPAASATATASPTPTGTVIASTPRPATQTPDLPSTIPIPAAPKAVIIAAPTHELTDSNLALAEKMAEQAEAAGMDVRRVFFPHATWENVLAQVQGASLVAYFGHGYGWPSNTPELWEVQQDGMGLNSYDGSAADEVKYYGANRIRESIRLAPHAVVFAMRGCYTAGNGLAEDPIPTLDVARQRVDNFASGWLAAGAGAVFAFASGTRVDYAEQLMGTDATIDALFITAHDHFGVNDLYFESQRTPGARSHLDPAPQRGYLRAVTGDLAMTTATWRSGAGQITLF